MSPMEAATLVLLHSPLVGVESWGRLAAALGRGGVAAVAVAVTGDEGAPFAERYVRGAVAGTLGAVAGEGPVVLVGHSGAGPLLGAVGEGLGAAGWAVGGYLFCDAGLPRDGATRLELLAEEDRAMAAAFRAELERGGRFPTWSDAELAPLVPDPDARAALVGSLRPRGLDFFTEPLPVAPGWPDAPCGYLRLSAAYDHWAAEAAASGWPATRLEAGHFHPLVDPDGVAAALLGLLARM
jgi:alpha/beta hydrolase family protein